MPYYMGDYYGMGGRYRGDYYRGDPGFWSTLGGIAKGVVGAVTGINLGSIGPKAVAAAAPAAAGAAVSKMLPASLKTAVGKAGAIVKAHPVLTAAGAAGLGGAVLGGSAEKVAMGRAAARLPAMGGRRHRRMRVTNVKALRRAIRRASGFAHLAKKVLSFTERRPHRGRVVFKRARKARRV